MVFSVKAPARYAELHCVSNFSFLRGASHPEELVLQAIDLGYHAIALTDECSLAGVVRAHGVAKGAIKFLIGAEFRLVEGIKFVLLAMNREGYGDLSALITQARRKAEKGSYCLHQHDVPPMSNCVALWIPQNDLASEAAAWFRATFSHAWIAVELLGAQHDREALAALRMFSAETGIPLVAAGDVHMHVRERRPVQDTLTAIRLGKPITELGFALHPNGERHLRPLARLRKIYPPDLIAETVHIAGLCHFSLDELRYEYPDELVPPGETPAQYLRQLTEAGMKKRWPAGVSEKVRRQVARELELIAELRYEPFFLTVHDIVCYARSQNILCQGRGSAANSAVCYCLGITEVSPEQMDMLFERFISRERNEPPDIDVDFEHDRREEVIQYVYRKYTRDRAALAATLITYRPRSALRDIGKALGLSLEQVDRLAKTVAWWDGARLDADRLRELGFDPESPVMQRLAWLLREMLGFPRHLSQHVGGFVISRGPLSRLVPIENAAMEDRTIIQWDKDDLEALGLLKVDCLALGMLSAIHRALDLVNGYRHSVLTLHTIPKEDPKVYAMIQKADTVGVFQIESRAQMAMLPRLKPKTFYDLVIEVAIVRPGPIQGDMVHPYLRRRETGETFEYENAEVAAVLERTLGVPIFQEQVIKLAIVAAGFTPGEADQLRRAMAAWKRKGGLEIFEEKLRNGMRERGFSEAFAQNVFRQIQGFGEYGFPESHATSFALLAYISSWLKYYEPAAFTCALLNSQPMGFYAPSQLIQDVRRHGVEVRAVNVQSSDYDCTLEWRDADGLKQTNPSELIQPALRLGFRLIKGLSKKGAGALVAARRIRAFESVVDCIRRAGLSKKDIEALAAADAFQGFTAQRPQAYWEASGATPLPALFSGLTLVETPPSLPALTLGEEVVADYASLGLSLRAHPMKLLRPRLQRMHTVSSVDLKRLPTRSPIRALGIVITRQHPGGAGVVFLTLEDEYDTFNVIVWRDLVEKYRRVILTARLIEIRGEVQHEGEVMHIISKQLIDRTALLGRLPTESRDFC